MVLRLAMHAIAVLQIMQQGYDLADHIVQPLRCCSRYSRQWTWALTSQGEDAPQCYCSGLV
jgi:hypothetical protein